MYLSTPVNGHDGLCACGHWNAGHGVVFLAPTSVTDKTGHS